MEYIQKKIQHCPTIIALTCKDGLVIFAEKSDEPNKKNFQNHSNMSFLNKINLIAGTGLFQDFNRILERAKMDSIVYRENFSTILLGKIFASRIASLVHLQTRYWHIRPLCCSLFLATINSRQPELYMITPTGHFFDCIAGVLGEKSEIFKISIDKILQKPLTCKKGVQKIYNLYKKTKKKFNQKHIEVSCFSKDNFSFKIPVSLNLLQEIHRKN